MIKKLAVAATFAASMTVGVPSASAMTPAECMFRYEAAVVTCSDEEGSSCLQAAGIEYANCMMKDAIEYN